MLKREEEELVAEAFVKLPLDAPRQTLIQLVAITLGLNQSQVAAITPDNPISRDDPEGRAAIHIRIAGRIEAQCNRLLREEGRIAPAVLLRDENATGELQGYSVVGLLEFLRQSGNDEEFIRRVSQIESIRNYLTGIGDGHKLEVLASAILIKIHKNSFPTRRSFDQGVDCCASQPIMELASWCRIRDSVTTTTPLGEKLHIIASCKANEGNTQGGIPATITPAHARELIGAWLIQRSSAGLWQPQMGIKLLSPIQLLLITTYRLSDETLKLCRELGVAVWSIPELIFLLCTYAPNSSFEPATGQLVTAGLDGWIDEVAALRV